MKAVQISKPGEASKLWTAQFLSPLVVTCASRYKRAASVTAMR
jgi:hypothetical protein